MDILSLSKRNSHFQQLESLTRACKSLKNKNAKTLMKKNKNLIKTQPKSQYAIEKINILHFLQNKGRKH